MNFANDIASCLKTLELGGTILYPTDTVWGIGCDATNAEAVSKIFSVKQRDEKKSMIILLANEYDINEFCKEPSIKIKSLLATTNKPLTIIYPQAKNLANNLINEDGTIAIRIVKDEFCKTLIEAFGKPIVSTSANISGEKPASVFPEITKNILKQVDYVCAYRRNDLSVSQPSKIVKWLDDDLIVIRE